MLRRNLFTFFAQFWGQSNGPECPLCHTVVDSTAPEYLPVVATPDAPSIPISLPTVRLCICQNCGNVFFTAVKL